MAADGREVQTAAGKNVFHHSGFLLSIIRVRSLFPMIQFCIATSSINTADLFSGRQKICPNQDKSGL